VCSILVLPARFAGEEVAQLFRRLFDHLVSNSDILFDLVRGSKQASDMLLVGQAWGTWILFGLFTALIAVLVTRWLAGKSLPWSSVVLVSFIWLVIYLRYWNWDGELLFYQGAFLPDAPNYGFGPLPYGGSFGFFGGFIAGLVLAATPWRAKGL